LSPERSEGRLAIAHSSHWSLWAIIKLETLQAIINKRPIPEAGKPYEQECRDGYDEVSNQEGGT